MLDILNELTKTDYLILSILATIIIIAGIILIIFITQKNKKKVLIDVYEETPKNEVKNKKPEVKMALATDNIEAIENVINNDIKIKPKKIVLDKIKNDAEVEPEKVELKPEISMSLAAEEIVEEELKKREQDMKNQTSIEEVLKAMQVDLEKDKFAKIDAYEEEQEKEAVITYQELRNKMMAKNQAKEEPIKQNYNDVFFDILDKNESVKEEIIIPENTDLLSSIDLPEDEIIEDESEIFEPYILRDEPLENKEGKYQGKLETKEFISPVFGKQNEDFIYPEIREIKKEEKNRIKDISLASETDDFLNTLKEFRNSL